MVSIGVLTVVLLPLLLACCCLPQMFLLGKCGVQTKAWMTKTNPPLRYQNSAQQEAGIRRLSIRQESTMNKEVETIDMLVQKNIMDSNDKKEG